MNKDIDLGYIPRDWQAHVHETRKRFSVWVLHRRAGKTVALCMEAIRTALETTGHPPRVALIYPWRNQAETVAWNILADYCKRIPGTSLHKSRLEITFAHNGAIIKLFGTHDGQYDAMRGLYFDLACFDEFAQCDARAMPEVVLPALADHKGDMILCGTPQGRDNFYDEWMKAGEDDTWSRYLLRASESGIIDDEELAVHKRVQGEEAYSREFECNFMATPAGAYFKNEVRQLREDNRVHQVDLITSLPLVAAMDIGINDATVCWVAQIVGTSINLLDCLVWRGQKLTDVMRDLRAQPYDIMYMGLPHDAGHREQTTGDPKYMMLMDLMPGTQMEVLPRTAVNEGIMLVRSLFSQFHFDVGCEDGLEYVSSYHRKYNKTAGVFMDTPDHKGSDHADALRYLCQLLDLLSGGDGLGSGGSIDQSVVSRRSRPVRVIGGLKY